MNGLSAGTAMASERCPTMKNIGHVAELWRYPVSSLSGEKCDRVHIEARGIVGDRGFGIYDISTGHVAAPEKETRWRPALFLQSTLDTDGLPRIHFPDGTTLSILDDMLSPRLSDHFGFHVGIGRYQHTDLPEVANLPIISNRYDPSPLHLVTTHSLRRLAQLASLDEMNHKRFRPSVLIDTDGAVSTVYEEQGFLEDAWLERTLNIGEVKVGVSEKAKRCGMTFIAQPSLNEQPEILRTLVRQNSRNFGVYCNIQQSGTLALRDNVHLETDVMQRAMSR